MVYGGEAAFDVEVARSDKEPMFEAAENLQDIYELEDVRDIVEEGELLAQRYKYNGTNIVKKYLTAQEVADYLNSGID